MKISTVTEIKKELIELSKQEIFEACLKLVKYKKENKELLHYLLFEAGNEAKFISAIKKDVAEGFSTLNKSNTYLQKKGLRKILRDLKKHIKYSGIKETEIDLLLYFCSQLKESKINIAEGTLIGNIYFRQLSIAMKLLEKLHEDIQLDYKDQVEKLLNV